MATPVIYYSGGKAGFDDSELLPLEFQIRTTVNSYDANYRPPTVTVQNTKIMKSPGATGQYYVQITWPGPGGVSRGKSIQIDPSHVAPEHKQL